MWALHTINNAHRQGEHPRWTPLHAPGLKLLAKALRIGLCNFSSYTITSILSSEQCHFSSRVTSHHSSALLLKWENKYCDASRGQAVKQLQIVPSFLLKFSRIISVAVPQKLGKHNLHKKWKERWIKIGPPTMRLHFVPSG